MLEELSRQVALSSFLPHGVCINWSPALLATYLASDLVIFLSYFSMPVAIVYFARRGKDFPYKWLLWMFAGFILACGMTHLMSTVVMWQPLYWLDAGLKAVTALISLATAVSLWPLIPLALRLPSPTQLQRANEELRQVIGERERAEGALRANHDFYHDVVNNGRALIWMADTDKSCFYFNQPWLAFTGRTLEQELGYGWSESVHPDDLEKCLAQFHRAFDEQERFSIVYRLLRHDGQYRWVLDDGLPRHDRNGMFVGYVGHCLDITERYLAEEALQIYANVFRHSGEAIMVTDRNNRIIDVNPAFTRHTGYTLEELRGQNPRVLSAGRTPPETYQDMWAALNGSGYWQGELVDRKKDGSCYPKWVTISTMRDGAGVLSHYVASFVDITERKASEEHIQRLAHHDALTGLLNRFSIESRMAQALATAKRQGTQLMVMFFDMDRFKEVNDTMGHHVGDELLMEIARRLRDNTRESDIVARLGGDEFLVVLTGVNSIVSVAELADALRVSLGQPYITSAGAIRTTPSIGISIAPDDGTEVDALIKRADRAMYRSKNQGGNRVEFFSSEDQGRNSQAAPGVGDLHLMTDRNLQGS